MQKSKREKIALLVFCLLIVLSLIGLGWYMLAGHSWNVAASTIDDTVGEMEGYTVIVYDGTLAPDEEEAGLNAAGAPDPAESAQPADAASEGPSAAEAADPAQSESTDPDDAEEEAEAEAQSLPALPFFGPSEEKTPIDLAALAADYRGKGAQVLALDVTDLARYREGTILKCGSKRIGVMSAPSGVTQLDVSRCMKAFEAASVDFTVVITPDRWKVQRITGIDIVICTEDENLLASGQTVNSTFYVDAPEIGSAGVVLISPSNVVSAKETSEL